MAKRHRALTPKQIEQRLQQGRGIGWGKDYLPWLTVQDVPSLGVVTRIQGIKTNRKHELFSLQETRYFYILDWSEQVTDIREQYPLLPLSETLKIAQDCGLRHPTDPVTRAPVVMTTDFCISVRFPIGVVPFARTVKPSQELAKKAVREKFEIERRYWENRNISWKIVTEHDIPTVLVKNIAWLHPRFHTSSLSLSEPEIDQIKNLLTHQVLQSNNSLAKIASSGDAYFNLRPGSSLSVARHLLATRQWLVDMNQPIHPSRKLVLKGTQLIP
ncbi:TnsA endonuclease C-terminal domain-containing protein [Coleofasciculus sp. G2-EDA-02]|uniref:TnsA endonuclease C-terminal domain-containing protein n=1 Tax=Coleofasciculus sp. G2-EDA-02 TaxID=3069529 RepID=UPI0032FF7692